MKLEVRACIQNRKHTDTAIRDARFFGRGRR